MSEPINTIYNKAVELALLTIDNPEEMAADELEFAVFQRAAKYTPLLSYGGTVPSMLKYVGESAREYVHVVGVESREDGDVLVCKPVVAAGDGEEDGDNEEDEVITAAEPEPEPDGDAEDEPQVDAAEEETAEEPPSEEDAEVDADAGEPEEQEVAEADDPEDVVDAIIEEDDSIEYPLPPSDTFLGITVRRILTDIGETDALVTIGSDTGFDVSKAFLADHKGCVVFAELA